MPYYGLYIPVKGAEDSTNGSNTQNSAVGDSTSEENKENKKDVSAFVFQDKKEALQVLKLHKDARFKEFLNEDDATKYAQTGFEVVQNKYNDVKTSTESIEKSTFRAPTRTQLISFRECIKHDDWQRLKKLIWSNPRYLVSSGDTPTILKEGYRYNAMHICAISNSPNVAQLILETVSDPEFVKLFMGNKNDEKSCKELCGKLLDYYLNMPEKGRCETPLHFASKYGFVSMVKVLTSYPQCKLLRNSDGKFPQYMICERGDINIQCQIRTFFDGRYYVPVLRSNDDTIPGQIGEPFSATDPPNLNCDPLSPKLEIKALAGPMEKERAETFYRRWKTPPRLGSNISSPIANNSYISPIKLRNSTPVKTTCALSTSFNSPTIMSHRRSLFNSTPQRKNCNGFIDSNIMDNFTDDLFDENQNGNEDKEAQENRCENKSESNNNNHLTKMPTLETNMLKMAQFPRTPLLFKVRNKAFSTYRDPNIDSPIVGSIELVQEYNDSLLNVSDVYDSPGFKERHVKNSDPEKGIECIGRVLARERYVEWREYWDFLDEFLDIASEYGIKKLEAYLTKRQKEQDERNNKSETIQKTDDILDVCNALENAFRITNNAAADTSANTLIATSHQSTTPYTYVEKSLQVHARRMTKIIIHNIDNEVSIIDALLLELRRVKSLIYSFKEDASYTNVNFEKVHSRIGNLVTMFLENSQEVTKQIKEKILIILQKFSLAQGERGEHMECVCSRIFDMLQHPTEQIQPENVKTEEICSKIWSQEKDCYCQWESNLSRKTSRRNRMEARYKNHQRLKQQEKIQKEANNQQQLPQSNDECDQTTSANGTSDEDEFWSDFGGSDSEEDEIFRTPVESPSRLGLLDLDSNKIFINGNEPTKRDLDVLNAIFHVSIDSTLYPNIDSWKTAMMCYTNEEMDYFPSPRIVKKSHSFVATSANEKDNNTQPQTPTSTYQRSLFVRSNTSSLIFNLQNQQSPLANSATTLSSSGIGGKYDNVSVLDF